jgi:hypothetical protein
MGDVTQGHEIMDWWLADDGRWHKGTPPAGWTQADDRRWYPTEPPSTAASYASKVESIARAPATVVWEDAEDWYDEEDPGQRDWDGDGWYGDGEAEDGIEDRGRRWSRRAGLAVAVAVLAAVTATLGIMARPDGAGESVSAPPATTTTTSSTPASVPASSGAGPAAPEETATPSTLDRAGTPPVSTRPTPSTTVGSPPDPPPEPGPPATNPPPTGPPGSIRQGGPCATVGATAVTANGTPVTCATAGCDGDPFDEPRWRRTAC